MKSSRAFSFADYSAIAARNESGFSDFGTVVTIGNREGNTYTFRDNGSDVLGVAHLDTVRGEHHASIIKVGRERVLLSPRLDDRLGVYIITRLLPKLGVNCDWLLTTGEESGCSSAEHFQTDKAYNWAFSFDRMGDDAVMYQFEHKALRKLVRKAGFRVGLGSFSDLSSLDIGCSGINFGCGYYDNHSLSAYALLSETFAMVDKFVRFFRTYASQPLPFNPRSRFDTMRAYDSRAYGSISRGYGHSDAYDYMGRNGYTRGWPDGADAVWETGEPDVDGIAVDQYLEWYYGQQSNGKSDADIIEGMADDVQRWSDNGR